MVNIIGEENLIMKCEYEADDGELRLKLMELLPDEARIDKIILKKYRSSLSGDFPNGSIEILFYAKF